MIKKQIIIVGIALILIFVALSGCFGDDSGNGDGSNGETMSSRLIGEWESKDSGVLYIFKSNGSYYINSPKISQDNFYVGTWEVKANQLCYYVPPEQNCTRYELSNNYKTLTFYDEDNSQHVFTKQESDNGDNSRIIESRFVGEWKFENAELSLIFESDGSFYSNNYSAIFYVGTWDVKGYQLCTTPKGEVEGCTRYEFSNYYKTLILFDDENNPTLLDKQ